MSKRLLCALPIVFLIGCTSGSEKPSATKPSKTNVTSKSGMPADTDVQTERNKLSPDVRALVDAQEWCPVTEERLGSMGAPIKLMIKEKAVFICCAGCRKKAESDADKTLAKVEELHERKKTNPPK